MARDEFWSDFRARAALVNQESPGTAGGRAGSRVHWSPGLVAVAACAIAAILIAGVTYYYDAVHGGPSAVEYVEVVASHGGVLIMNDEDTDGTILWVVDMELDEPDGDSI